MALKKEMKRKLRMNVFQSVVLFLSIKSNKTTYLKCSLTGQFRMGFTNGAGGGGGGGGGHSVALKKIISSLYLFCRCLICSV